MLLINGLNKMRRNDILFYVCKKSKVKMLKIVAYSSCSSHQDEADPYYMFLFPQDYGGFSDSVLYVMLTGKNECLRKIATQRLKRRNEDSYEGLNE